MNKFKSIWHLNNSVCELQPSKLEDDRGFFSEVFQNDEFKNLGIKDKFIQDNQSLSENKFTFRGLHFQKPPFEQAKLVRVLRGSILDIAVDLRKNSATYLEHVSIELSEQKFNQLYIPIGFAHGFLTLEKNCEILYKVSNPYNHQSDISLNVFDQKLKIDLGSAKDKIILSEKDKNAVSVNDIGGIF